MADPRKFNGQNYTLPAPPGMEEFVTPLPCCVTESGIISCWQLTGEEKAKIAETGVVWLFVAGKKHPPVKVSGLPAMEQRDEDGNLQPYEIDAASKPAKEE